MDRKPPYWLIYVLIAIGLVAAAQGLWTRHQQVAEIDYSRFLEQLEEGNIDRVQVSERHIWGEFKEPLTEDGPTDFRTTRVDPEIAEKLEVHDVTYQGRVEDGLWPNILIWLLPVGLLIGFWSLMLRRIGGGQGLMSIGKSKAKITVEEDTGVSFDDVAGVDEAKMELQETVSFLKDPKHYGRLGARQPKGILLVGPPGTGKTLLARAVAGEANVPFFSISGSEFVEMFVGVGAARVRDLFEQARKAAPSIIFIDELDALGQARGAGQGMPSGGQSEKEQTLNQLLNEMQGFDTREGVVILGATNQPQVLDPALLRAGRFDRQVLVDRPDKKGRLAILKVHANKVKLADDIDLDQIAGLTAGFSGADLENLVNEAAIQATRRNADAIATEDFTAAVERIVAGLEQKSRVLRDRERRTVAHHELGHAIVAWLLPGVDEVHKVSIIPRGIGALGYTMQRPTEDRFLMTETELQNRITVLFGGRAAERLVFDQVTTGAADDIQKATDIARNMVTRFGMSKTVGQVTFEEPRGYLEAVQRRPYADETAEAIDAEVRAILDGCFEQASIILRANRKLLDQAVARLLEAETLERDELREVLADAKLPEARAEDEDEVASR
ncbi:MAG: ATP-dependent metallopeptidase FtsH/Yme1/Tma family protein [Rhodospirillales bacterium]|nr:MAG: ATP-dependent metallopeptidase FtsH/Yme1/Tma family protein [Rhodospirillales bacterium]